MKLENMYSLISVVCFRSFKITISHLFSVIYFSINEKIKELSSYSSDSKEMKLLEKYILINPIWDLDTLQCKFPKEKLEWLYEE